MKLLFALLWMVFCTLQVSAQSKKELKKFLKLFPETTLPVCYEYGDSALVWDEEYGIEIGIHKTDSALQIPTHLARIFLLPPGESMFVEIGLDSVAYSYYPLHLVSKTSHYYAFTFERQQADSWYPSSEKFLVTLDKKGAFIAKAEIASFRYGGTFLYDDSDKEIDQKSNETDSAIPEEENDEPEGQTFMRMPYFPRSSGCITGKNTPLSPTQTSSDSHFTIGKKGNITKIK